MFCASLPSVSPGRVASNPIRDSSCCVAPTARGLIRCCSWVPSTAGASVPSAARLSTSTRIAWSAKPAVTSATRTPSRAQRPCASTRTGGCSSAGAQTIPVRAYGIFPEDSSTRTSSRSTACGARCERRRASSWSYSTSSATGSSRTTAASCCASRGRRERTATGVRQTTSSSCSGSSQTLCRRPPSLLLRTIPRCWPRRSCVGREREAVPLAERVDVALVFLVELVAGRVVHEHDVGRQARDLLAEDAAYAAEAGGGKDPVLAVLQPVDAVAAWLHRGGMDVHLMPGGVDEDETGRRRVVRHGIAQRFERGDDVSVVLYPRDEIEVVVRARLRPEECVDRPPPVEPHRDVAPGKVREEIEHSARLHFAVGISAAARARHCGTSTRSARASMRNSTGVCSASGSPATAASSRPAFASTTKRSPTRSSPGR